MWSLTSTFNMYWFSSCLTKQGNNLSFLPWSWMSVPKKRKICVQLWRHFYGKNGKTETPCQNGASREKQDLRKRCIISKCLNLDIDGVNKQLQALAALLAVLTSHRHVRTQNRGRPCGEFNNFLQLKFINPFKIESPLTFIQKYSSFLKENIIWITNWYFFDQTHKHILWAKIRFF